MNRMEDRIQAAGCSLDGQQQIQPVGWIEQSGLEASKEVRSREDVGIPESQVSLGQLTEAKLVPIDELRGKIGTLLSEENLTR
jgi:hypothetical protein